MVHKEASQAQPVSDLLMELLVCPACKGDLQLTDRGTEQTLVCRPCRLAYPVRDGIPIMLLDKALAVD